MSSYFNDDDYYSEAEESDKVVSDEEEDYIPINKKKNTKIDKKVKISDELKIDDDDEDVELDDDDDDVEEDVDEDVDLEDDIKQYGGADDDDEYVAEDDDDANEDNEDNDEQEEKKGKKTIKELPPPIIYDMQEEEDEEEDDDADGKAYLKKFDKDIQTNYIMNFHPECIHQNYDEVESLTKVFRDNNGVVIDDLHRTVPYLTKYERTRILGQRAKQINAGSTPFVKVPENVIDGYLIAELELQQKRIPFIIRRPLPNGGSEYWNVKDLENISF